MDYTEDIMKLFSNVMKKEIYQLKIQDIRKAFANMAQAYAVNSRWMYNNELKKTEYNNAAHSINRKISRKYINVCSLGGGPGTDIVALLFVLDEVFGLVQCDATIMDISGEWQQVFKTIISELQTGSYGMSAMVAKGFFNYQYLELDLLRDSGHQARGIIGEADIITMVKFVSAAACSKTRGMIRRIFQSMKLGAMVLFIDNAAGGFHELLQEEAGKCGLESVFGPMTHYNYEELTFRRELHGSVSQFQTKVAVEMWMKPGQSVVRAQMDVAEIDGPGRETVQLNSRKTESDWRCCSIV